MILLCVYQHFTVLEAGAPVYISQLIDLLGTLQVTLKEVVKSDFDLQVCGRATQHASVGLKASFKAAADLKASPLPPAPLTRLQISKTAGL